MTKRSLYLSAFLLPFSLAVFGLALTGVFPFGPYQGLIVDAQQQYYPFLAWLRRTLLAGDLSAWTWDIGMGTAVWPLFSYYISSPLNLLLLPVPQAWLREGVQLLTCVRLGLAGVAFAAVMRGSVGEGDKGHAGLIAFSTLYALCGFAIAYQNNLIWLETFWLAPICVMLALRALRTGRPGLYPAALALALWCNFYVGFMLCLFIALSAIAACAAQRRGIGRLLRLLAFSVVGAGMAAAVLLPSLRTVLQYEGETAQRARDWLLYSPAQLIGNFALMTEPTFVSGLPNVFSGVLGVCMAAAYLTCGGVPRRERVAVGLLSLLLLASCLLSPLDFVWNALHAARSLPARFSFLLSLTLLYMAARAFFAMAAPGLRQVLAVGACGLIVSACAALGGQGLAAALATLAATAVYCALLGLWGRGILPRRAAAWALVLCVALECAVQLGVSAGVQRSGNYLALRDEYPYRPQETYAMLDTAAQLESIADAPRVEITLASHAFNAPALLGYRGVASFSSMQNYRLGRFLGDIGLQYRISSYGFVETSPLSASMLGVGAYVARDGYMADRAQFWSLAATDWGVSLYENKYPLALGFAVSDALRDYSPDANPFTAQNELLTAATGVPGPLFIEHTDAVHPAEGAHDITQTGPGAYAFTVAGEDPVRWEATVPEDGLYYIYVESDVFELGHYGMGLGEHVLQLSRSYIRCIGRYEAGDELYVEGEPRAGVQDGNARVLLARVDADAFEAGYAKLSRTQLREVDLDGPRVTATVEMPEAGLLFTSVPYEDGWTATIDGERADIVPISDALIALDIPEGTHTLRLDYVTPGVGAGIAISCACTAAWALALVVGRRRAKAKSS